MSISKSVFTPLGKYNFFFKKIPTSTSENVSSRDGFQRCSKRNVEYPQQVVLDFSAGT